MGKVQSVLRHEMGGWRDEKWRNKDARAWATAVVVGSIGAASAAFLWRTHVRPMLDSTLLLLEATAGLGFLWYRTDKLMDAQAPLRLHTISAEEHGLNVQEFAKGCRAMLVGASGKESQSKGEASGSAGGHQRHHRPPVGAGHDKSNSFGRVVAHGMPRFNGSALIALQTSSQIDGSECTVTVEPGMSMDQLFAATIESGLVAPVITEFPGITVGGAIMGGALESSSIRNQHFADALVALEVVLADGRIVQCSSAENADLFFGIRGSYGSIGRVTSCTLRLERLADLAADAAVAAEQAGRQDEQQRRKALELQSSSSKRIKEDHAPALNTQELAMAIAGQAVEFKVQVSYVLCPTVEATIGLLEALTKHRDSADMVPEAKRIHFVDGVLFQRTHLACGFLARLSGNIVMIATVVAESANTHADANAGYEPAFSGDWFICHVAKVLDDFCHAGAAGITSDSHGTAGAASAAWSESFHSWLLSRHASCVIHTDRPIPLRDYLFRYDRGAFWMGFMSLPCLCRFAKYGIPCIDGLRKQDTRFRGYLGARASTRNLYRCLHAVPKPRQRRNLLIHDFQLPFSGALEYLQGRTGVGGIMAMLAVSPVWLCPIKATREPRDLVSCHAAHHFPPNVAASRSATAAAASEEFGFPVTMSEPRVDEESTAYINIGVYGPLRKLPLDILENLPIVKRHLPLAAGDPSSHVPGTRGRESDPRLMNWVLEAECTRLGGRKLLYSQLYSGEHVFWFARSEMFQLSKMFV
eukprot:INCI4824.3.p1 GENE.INCI4824.3~~INCI4824.3.p1  ORF type:complete len:756 (-),score=111.87 INCI4824.3:2285-4552(-)